MKTIQIISPILISLLLGSCSENAETLKAEIAAKRSEITAANQDLDLLINKLDSLEGKKLEEFQIVKAFPVKTSTFESYVKVHGMVTSDKNINIIPEGMGIVRKVLVQRGSKVRAGQVLAYLDSDVINKNLKELETSLSFASTVFEKQKKLYDQNVGTELQYLEAKNRKESLEQTLSTLQTQKSKNVITSPISGEIDELFASVGDMANQQMPFARIVNTSDVYADADLSEAFINQVKVGDQVLIKFPYTDQDVPVKITYKSNFINPNNRTFKVHASLVGLKEEFVPNMMTILKVRNHYVPQAIVINNTSINTDIKGDFVFVLDQKEGSYTARKVYVERGVTYQNESVINKGLSANDLLVSRRYQTLSDGNQVQLAK